MYDLRTQIDVAHRRWNEIKLGDAILLKKKEKKEKIEMWSWFKAHYSENPTCLHRYSSFSHFLFFSFFLFFLFSFFPSFSFFKFLLKKYNGFIIIVVTPEGTIPNELKMYFSSSILSLFFLHLFSYFDIKAFSKLAQLLKLHSTKILYIIKNLEKRKRKKKGKRIKKKKGKH